MLVKLPAEKTSQLIRNELIQQGRQDTGPEIVQKSSGEVDEHEAGGEIENDTQGFDNRNFVESCRGPWGGQQVERHGIGNTKRWIVLRDRGRVEVTVEDVDQTVGVEVPVRAHEQWKEDDGHLEEEASHQERDGQRPLLRLQPIQPREKDSQQ